MDLSHEFDYVSWLAGPMVVDHVIYKKVSNLQIESKDLLHFSGKTQSGAYVQITLNYFTRDPIRQIIIDGEGISIQGDLIANTLTVTLEGKTSKFSWTDLERNETYRDMHLAILKGDMSKICSYDQGLKTMGLIESILLMV